MSDSDETTPEKRPLNTALSCGGLIGLEGIFEKAKNGDVRAAQAIVKHSGECIRAGHSLRPEVAEWLGSALVAAAEKPSKAGALLGMSPLKPGRPTKRRNALEDFAILAAARYFEEHKYASSKDGSDGPLFEKAIKAAREYCQAAGLQDGEKLSTAELTPAKLRGLYYKWERGVNSRN